MGNDIVRYVDLFITTLLLVDAKIMVSSNCPIIGEQVAVIQGHLKFSKV